MAELIWTQPALEDLDRIADYIAIDDLMASKRLVQRVFQHVEQLETHPESGSRPAELRASSRRYRQIVEPPCRVIYRYDRSKQQVLVLYVMRGEMRLRTSRLRERGGDDRRK